MRLITAFCATFMLFAPLATPAFSQTPSAFEPLEIRLVAQEAEGGTEIAVEGGGTPVEVEPETLLGPSDFVSVSDVEWTVEGTQKKPGFNVTLTPAGAEEYEQISTENVGRTLAFIVDGKVLMTPKILDPVRAQGFLLTVETEAEAKELATKLRDVIAVN